MDSIREVNFASVGEFIGSLGSKTCNGFSSLAKKVADFIIKEFELMATLPSLSEVSFSCFGQLSPVHVQKESHQVNFRNNGFVQKYVDSQEMEKETFDQIQNDVGRILGLNVQELKDILTDVSNPLVRRNILFSLCQNFEVAVARWCTNLFGSGQEYSVMQNNIDEQSTIVCDRENKQTILTSKLKARKFDENGGFQEIEKFEVAAVFDWQTAIVTITKRPIK